jgi:hypothetical protein
MERLRRILMITYRRKWDVGVVFIWSFLISIMLIYNFHSFHQENPFTMSSYGSPGFSPFERIAIVILSLVATLLISDIKRVVYGYFMSMALSFIISTLLVFIYIWSVFHLGLAFQEIPFGWEIAFFSSLTKVFGFIVPIGITFSLIGVVVGTLVSFLYKYA